MGEGDRQGLSRMVIPAISSSRKELPEAVPGVFSQQEASEVRQQKRKKNALSPQERMGTMEERLRQAPSKKSLWGPGCQAYKYAFLFQV